MELTRLACFLTALAFIAFFLAGAAAQQGANSPPEITFFSVLPESRETGENSVFEFIAEAIDPDGDALSYEWYFRGAHISNDRRTAYWAGNILYPSEDESYEVKLLVRDGKGGVASRSDEVRVKAEGFNLMVSSPSSTPFSKIKKEAGIPVNLKVEYRDGTIIKNLGKVEAKIKGIPVELEKKDETGNFEGTLDADRTFGSLEYLEIEITAPLKGEMVTQKDSFPVFFKPLEIVVESPEFLGGGSLYLHSAVGGIRVMPKYLESGEPVQGMELTGILKSNGKPVEELVFNEESGEYFAESGYVISKDDIELGRIGEEKGLQLVLSGMDAYENSILDESGFGVKVEKSNPHFNLTVENPPEHQKEFCYGQEIRFRAKVLTETGGEIGDARVFVSSEEFSLDREMERNGEGYFLDFRFPEDSGAGTGSFLIWAESAEKKAAAFEKREVELSNSIVIEIIRPVEGEATAVELGGLQKITLALSYPNGNPFDGKGLAAKLTVDGREFEAELESEGSGIYSALLPSPLQAGSHDIGVEMLGEWRGSREIKAELEADVNPLLFLLAVVAVSAIISFFIIYLFTSRFKEKAAKLEKLLRKKTMAKARLKNLRLNYLRRKISEDEYKKEVLKAEQEIDTADKAIKEKTKKVVKKLRDRERERETEAKKEGVPAVKRGMEELKLPPPAKLVKEKPFEKAVKERVEKIEEARTEELKVPALDEGKEKREEKKETEEKLIEIISSKRKEQEKEKERKEAPKEEGRKEKEAPKEKKEKGAPGKKKEKMEKRAGFFSRIKSRVISENAVPGKKKKKDKLDWYTDMQVKKLVKLLRKKKEKYSKDEIFSIIVEQGYLPEVAQKVVDELF